MNGTGPGRARLLGGLLALILLGCGAVILLDQQGVFGRQDGSVAAPGPVTPDPLAPGPSTPAGPADTDSGYGDLK